MKRLYYILSISTLIISTSLSLPTTAALEIDARADNGSAITNGSIKINEENTEFNSTGWASLSEISHVTAKRVYFVKAVNCSGVTDFTQTAASPSIIWDRINVNLSVSDRIDVGSKADVRWSAIYEYDGEPFQGKVNIQIINSQTSVPTPVGKGSYRVESIEESKYGLTVFTFNQMTGSGIG